MSKYKYNQDFFKTWSHDMAYILGFIMADGCVANKPAKLSIGLNPKDIEILLFITSKLCPNLKIADGKRYDKKYKKWYFSKRIAVCNQEIVKDLQQLSVIPRKTGFEVIPEKCPEEFIMDFIRGFFDGDGCISQVGNKSSSVIIGSASLKILTQIKNRCNLGNIIKKKNKHFWHLQITSFPDVQKFASLIYSNNFALKRKHDKFVNLIPPRIPRWTMVENQILKNHLNNLSLASEKIGKSYDTVVAKVARDNLKIRAKKPMWTNEQIDYIKMNFDFLNPNESIKKIAIKFNRTFSSVSHKVSRLKLCNLRKKINHAYSN